MVLEGDEVTTVEEVEEPGINMDNFHWGEDIRYRFEKTTDAFKFYEITLTEVDLGTAGTVWTLHTAYGSMKPGAHITHKSEDYSSKWGAENKMTQHIRKRQEHGYTQVEP